MVQTEQSLIQFQREGIPVNGLGYTQIFATTAGRPLAEQICKKLSLELGNARVGRFNDNEVDVQLLENVRDSDAFVIAPTPAPADNFMEAVLLGEALRMSSAGRVTFVIPYMGYNRSDRKDAPRKPIGSRIALRLLQVARPHRYIFLDVHAEQTLACIDEGVFDHLFGSAVFLPVLKQMTQGKDFVVASPDKGGGPRAEKYSRLLGQEDFVFFSKSRSAPGVVKEDSIKIIGDVGGKVVILVDDMIDSGGTVVADARAARAAGAKEIYVFATHGIFSKDALERIAASDIQRVYVTDSIAHDPKVLGKCKKIEVVSIAELLAKAIRRTHEGKSLSELIP